MVMIDSGHIDASSAVAARRRDAVGVGRSTVDLVQRSARELVPIPLPWGIRRIEPIYDWDDIGLTDASKQLMQAISMHVLQTGRGLEEWGFASRVPYGQGVTAQFRGPSGTMSAQIIAGDLGVDLLDRIFEAAEQAAAVRKDGQTVKRFHPLQQTRHLDVGVPVIDVSDPGALAEDGIGLVKQQSRVRAIRQGRWSTRTRQPSAPIWTRSQVSAVVPLTVAFRDYDNGPLIGYRTHD